MNIAPHVKATIQRALVTVRAMGLWYVANTGSCSSAEPAIWRIVYKAEHISFQEVRALEVINADLATDEIFVLPFKQEALLPAAFAASQCCSNRRH